MYLTNCSLLKHSSIHLVVCLTTGPQPLPKRALHIVRSRASSFKWEYPLLSLWSSNSLLLYTSGKYLQEWDTNIIIKLYQFLHSPYIIIFSVAHGPGPIHVPDFTITFRHTTLGSTHLDEWSARRRNLYLTTHNTHKRQTSVLPAGFEPVIRASEKPKTNVWDGAATGVGSHKN